MYCQHEEGIIVALMKDDEAFEEDGWYACGGVHLRSSRGGCAYGIPRNSATLDALGLIRPCT